MMLEVQDFCVTPNYFNVRLASPLTNSLMTRLRLTADSLVPKTFKRLIYRYVLEEGEQS